MLLKAWIISHDPKSRTFCKSLSFNPIKFAFTEKSFGLLGYGELDAIRIDGLSKPTLVNKSQSTVSLQLTGNGTLLRIAVIKLKPDKSPGILISVIIKSNISLSSFSSAVRIDFWSTDFN